MKKYACLPGGIFEHNGYLLRPIQPTDIEHVRVWRNAQLCVLRQNKPISVVEQVTYYEQHVWPEMGEVQPSCLLFGFLKDQQLIGYGGLVHIDWGTQNAEVSFLLDPARTTEPEKYGTDFMNFLNLIKRIAFDGLNFNRLFTETYAIRKHHIYVLERSAFLLERVLVDHVVIDGQKFDSLVHGCLKNYER